MSRAQRGAMAVGSLLMGALALLLLGASAWGAPLAVPARIVPLWGDDIPVSGALGGPYDIQRNSTLAVNPAQPAQIAASFDSLGDSTNSGVATSTDAGRTWSSARFYGPWLPGTGLQPTGNTSIGFDQHSVLYYSSQAADDVQSGYFVLTTTLGQPWHSPMPVVLSDYMTYRDQATLAVDPRAAGAFAGRVYLAWRVTDLSGAQRIALRTSADGGQTWSGDIVASAPNHVLCASPAFAIARDGSVYLTYAIAPPPRLGKPITFYLVHSTDGGATWGPAQPIGGGPINRIGALDIKARTLVLLGDALGGAFIVDNTPALAVAPSDPNTVYATWNDGRWETDFDYAGRPGRHSDIAFSRSTDGGATWTAPQRVNNDPLGDGVDQFAPAIAVAADGVVGLTWDDRREDARGYLYNLYYSQSADGGQTWAAGVRVSDVPSDPMALRNHKGEGVPLGFNSLVYGPGYVLPSWVDSRVGRVQEIYTDRGLLPTPTPGPPPVASGAATLESVAGSGK